MSEGRPWVALGRGTIGGAFIDRVAEPGQAEQYNLQPEPHAVIRHNGIYDADNNISSIKDWKDLAGFDGVVFNMLPSTEDGKEAMEFTKFFLDQGATVITAEKTALARNHGDIGELSDNFNRFRYTAAVGGGSRLLPVMRVLLTPINQVSEMHGVFNGSWASLSNLVGPADGQRGVSLGRGVRVIRQQKLLDPLPAGQTEGDPIDTAMSERTDLSKKVTIVCNTFFANAVSLATEPRLEVDEIPFELDRDQAKHVFHDQPQNYRAITSFYNLDYHEPIDPEAEGIIGGFNATRYGFQIVSGFQLFAGHTFKQFLGNLPNANNGIALGRGPSEKYADAYYEGPGAGPDPTVDALLYDALA